MRPTVSITSKVTAYCRSLAPSRTRGAAIINAAAPTTVATTDASRPKRTATSTTVSKNSMAMLARSKCGHKGMVRTAVARLAPMAIR